MFGREELVELAVCVGGLPGERSGLVEGALVEEALDSLSHGEPAALVLALDALVAAHPPRELLAPAQLLELGLPVHGRRGYGPRKRKRPAARTSFDA